ncbi:adenylate cyclase [Ramlibacter tataouinensis]|uniref:Adenylate cyclase-like protein n=1 Tax=Ramlibacter tataouinensis (strain ATCC BAA-407 / DSM 14655 / LMG 21543 / TTB310) TaxID=365046 RepID=F5XYI5_RAMTT|nr:adenylate cyclase [Ramlibacter tataouinensis]AEG93161.1 adenylate cyclase-like protein [Ramlibacter tataouinensis TTB310]
MNFTQAALDTGHDASGSSVISFEQRVVTLLCIDSPGMAGWPAPDRESFAAEVDWLASRHQGKVDRQRASGTVLFFEDPGCALQMALNLQRCASELRLRIGLHTAPAGIASFRVGSAIFWCVVGPATVEVAQVAATACGGSIVISPEAYALVRNQVREAPGCLLTEEFDGEDSATASLTPAPSHGDAAASTFAGLGMGTTAWAT